MSLTPHLFLIRHGETEWSLTGQHTGRTDIALTEQGKMQADELGQRLRGIDFDEVLTSPLIRARETCERAVPDSRCESEPDLAEWHYGITKARRPRKSAHSGRIGRCFETAVQTASHPHTSLHGLIG